jgi:hypothetical protein
MLDHIRRAGRARWLAPFAALTLAAGCRERAPEPADSSLAQDLALAQRALPPQAEFNDAPLGGTSAAVQAPAAPTRDPGPSRARAPRPTPSPRRTSPPAAVAPAPRQPTPQATAPAPQPAPAAGVIGAGTRIGMTTNARVCTRDLLVGDKYTATVTSVTIGSNGALIPAGSTVVLEVASVERANPIETSRIGFHVRSIDVNGVPQQAVGDVATLGALEQVQAPGGNDRNKIIGGAVAGAVLGRIFGGSTKATVIGAAAGGAAGTVAARAGRSSEACLPQGSTLQLTLARDIVMRRDGPI